MSSLGGILGENRRYHLENLPESLLEVGDELLASRSHDSFRIRELASLVPEKPGGVSHTAVFGHYSSMPDYLTALAARWWSFLGEELRFDSSDDTPIEIALRYVQFALENPHAFRLMYDAALWEPSRGGRIAEARFEALRQQRDGCFEQFALSVRSASWGQTLSSDAVIRAARLFAALSHGLAMEFLDEQLFGHVNGPVERRRSQLRHARELLELAQQGAASGG